MHRQNVVTGAGETDGKIDGWPVCPFSLPPQQTMSAARRAHVWSSPRLTWRIPFVDTGPGVVGVPARSSCKRLLSPQHQTLPDSSRAQELDEPLAMAERRSGSIVVFGMSELVSESIPSCRR